MSSVMHLAAAFGVFQLRSWRAPSPPSPAQPCALPHALPTIWTWLAELTIEAAMRRSSHYAVALLLASFALAAHGFASPSAAARLLLRGAMPSAAFRAASARMEVADDAAPKITIRKPDAAAAGGARLASRRAAGFSSGFSSQRDLLLRAQKSQTDSLLLEGRTMRPSVPKPEPPPPLCAPAAAKCCAVKC